jgi:hypothetical protein
MNSPRGRPPRRAAGFVPARINPAARRRVEPRRTTTRKPDWQTPRQGDQGRSLLGLLVCAALLLWGPTASAQERNPSLAVGGLVPGGIRNSATESWGTYDFTLSNRTDTDRLGRVLVFFEGRPDLQYGRDVWLPAHSTLATWMFVGPAPEQEHANSRAIDSLLYDRSDSNDHLVLPSTEERVRSRLVLYRKREPYTTILLDDEPDEDIVFGRLPQPESRSEEALRLTRSFRSVRNLSGLVQTINPGPLVPSPEAFEGIDHFVLASGRIKNDPAGMQALRRWLERGGKVWVMLDLVEPDVIAPLLGDALDFQVVDRVSLTTLKIETPASGLNVPDALVEQHEQPVAFVRVLLPAQERVQHTINGWPVWFSRPVGRGNVGFTTLGPRGWYRPRTRSDPPSPYDNFPTHPVPLAPLEFMADELQMPREEDPYRVEAFRPALAEEIGYSVVSRTAVGLVFGAFLLATLALGIVLGRSRRPELLGWVGPAAAVGATLAFLALGEASRRAASPTVAVAQVVDAVSGTDEAAVHGLLAVYRPDSGAAPVGAGQGGVFELDLAGIEGQTRRRIQTDLDAWHWENLALPAGVRTASFRYTAPTREPIAAVAGFGPEGVEGKLKAGPFQDLADALLTTPHGRSMAVRLHPDGTFSAGSQDVLPPGQFLASSVLSDQQQRRQELYREFLKRPPSGFRESRNLLLAWAQPIDMHFTLAPAPREVGSALLIIPLQLERPAPGARVTIPGPLLPYQQVRDGRRSPPSLMGDNAADLHFRFQLPAAVLPLEVERARLVARIAAPSRRVALAGQAAGGLVEVHHVESPLDPLRVEITEPRLLRLDNEGGLSIHVTLSDFLRNGEKRERTSPLEEKWTIEYLELEVSGRTAP